MIYDSQHLLLALYVIDLLKLNDSALLEALERHGLRIGPIAPVLDQAHAAERARTQRRQDVEIV